MKDFTKKGTKLPVIPVGTKFRTLNCDKSSSLLSREICEGYSFGMHNEKWLKADQLEYKGFNHYLIKLSTIERLAKEQGIRDDEPMKIGFVTTWTSKSFSNPSNLEYAINKIRLEKEKEALEIASKIIRNALQYSQSLLKSQQMNPTIKLQENGTVTVTDTETTTTLSKATVDEICRLVKEQPKLRKINVWYGSKEYPKLCWHSDESNCYGLNWKGNWEFKSRNSKELSTLTDDDYELSPETVEQYLRDEAVKRGYEKGTKYKHIKFDTVEVLKQPENLKLNIEYNNLTDGCGGSIFDEGVWATILKPETITIAEAEKQTVFVVRHKETGNDFGTFSTREKAEKYIATSSNFTIVENSVN